MGFSRKDSDEYKVNTVDPLKELDVKDNVSFVNKDGCGKRIMFAGNSTLRHGVSERIGWLRDCGMAASSEDKDYAHILMKRVSEIDPNAVFHITQCSTWERRFWDDEVYKNFEAAKDFAPDILIYRLGENVTLDSLKDHDLKDGIRHLIKYLTEKNPNAEVIFTTNFWIREAVDNAIIEVAAEYGKEAHDLGLIGENPEMKALGLFEHAGVAAHPGDKGMEAIADVIWNELKELMMKGE